MTSSDRESYQTPITVVNTTTKIIKQKTGLKNNRMCRNEFKTHSSYSPPQACSTANPWALPLIQSQSVNKGRRLQSLNIAFE